MSEWKELTLSDITLKVTDGAHHSPKEYKGGKPMFSIKDMIEQGFDYENAKTISNDDFDKLINLGCQPEIDDILIAKDGSVLKHIFQVKYKPDYVLLSSIAIIRPNKKLVEPSFLVYAIKEPSVKDFILTNFVGGSGVPRIVLKDFKQIELKIPNKEIQKAIASILSSLDDKIDLLNRQNITLEKMAETLFRQWFVEEAKEEWEMGKIEDLFILQRGFDLPIQNRVSGGYPIYASSGESGYHIEFKVKGPGVTTGRSGVLGNVFYIQEDFWPLNTSLFIKEYKNSNPLHSYFVLKTIDLNSFNAGSAVPTLNRNHVHESPVEIPPMKLIDEFEKIVKPLFEKIKSNQTQIRTLTALRDTLLPKLMSGEVRVS